MSCADIHVTRAQSLERARRFTHGTRRVDHVVDQQTIPPADLANDVDDFGHVGLGSSLVDYREGGIEPLRETTGHLRAPDIGRDDDRIHQLLLSVVCGKHRRGVEVIDGNVEEPLKLMLVKIHSHNSVGASLLDHVCQKLCADRHSRLVLAVLSRIPVVRHDHSHPSRGGAKGCIDHEQQLHDVVSRRIRGLNDEHIVATNVFIDPDKKLAVRESRRRVLAQLDPHVARNLFCERLVGGSGEQLGAVTRYGQAVHFCTAFKVNDAWGAGQ